MAIAPLFVIRRAMTRAGLWAVPLVAALSIGCVSIDTLTFWQSAKAAGPVPCQVVCLWQPNILSLPDVLHNGTPTPGLACRLFLFGPEKGSPLIADGAVRVELFDETKDKPVMVEWWEIAPDALKSQVSKDIIGPGYTLFLPLSKHTPDMTKLRLHVAYKGLNSPMALFADNNLTLAEGNGIIREGTSPLSAMPGRPTIPAGPLGVNPGLPLGPTMQSQSARGR